MTQSHLKILFIYQNKQNSIESQKLSKHKTIKRQKSYHFLKNNLKDLS